MSAARSEPLPWLRSEYIRKSKRVFYLCSGCKLMNFKVKSMSPALEMSIYGKCKRLFDGSLHNSFKAKFETLKILFNWLSFFFFKYLRAFPGWQLSLLSLAYY